MKRVVCPCCGNYTFEVESEKDIIIDICEVCFWQYDLAAHSKPNVSIGPNKLSLNEARENYKQFGAKREKFANDKFVRQPLAKELPENNESIN